jgi:hypothetical protein
VSKVYNNREIFIEKTFLKQSIRFEKGNVNPVREKNISNCLRRREVRGFIVLRPLLPTRYRLSSERGDREGDEKYFSCEKKHETSDVI